MADFHWRQCWLAQKLPKMSYTKFNSLSLKFALRNSNENHNVYYINRPAFKWFERYKDINNYFYYYHFFVNMKMHWPQWDFWRCGITFDPWLYNIGIHGFSCISIRQVTREVLKTEASVFNTSLGTWRMLTHWKIMFDRYYCIKTENICSISRYFLHYFVPPFHRCLANAIFHGLCSFWCRALHISWRQQFCGPGTNILKVS